MREVVYHVPPEMVYHVVVSRVPTRLTGTNVTVGSCLGWCLTSVGIYLTDTIDGTNVGTR